MKGHGIATDEHEIDTFLQKALDHVTIVWIKQSFVHSPHIIPFWPLRLNERSAFAAQMPYATATYYVPRCSFHLFAALPYNSVQKRGEVTEAQVSGIGFKRNAILVRGSLASFVV